MINRRLVLVPSHFHFSQWEIGEYRKYFREVRDLRKHRSIRSDDILLIHSWNWMHRFSDVKCYKRFGMLFPGFGFQPWMIPDHVVQAQQLLQKYDAAFVNDGPVWERMQNYPKVHWVPFSADHKRFVKTRKRNRFEKIIQVARNDFYKGRHISEAAMKLLPYKWELHPKPTTGKRATRGYKISWESLSNIYQSADGFLSPNMIGLVPDFQVDAKYNQATMEAGLSGCLIFWHDIMDTGNDFETVFPISLDPKEIAEKIRDVVISIDLDKHSTLTSQEFHEKCNVEKAVKAKVEIMKGYL